MTRKLILGESGFSEQMAKDVEIQIETIDQSFIEQASLFAYYAEQSKAANKREMAADLQLDVIKAKIDKAIREEHAELGKKVTENGIETLVLLNPDFQKAKVSYIEAKTNALLLRDYLTALSHKRDCLVQLGKASREDGKSQVRSLSDDKRPKKYA